MEYGSILYRAWRITWRYRILWLFGLLAGLGIDLDFNVRNLPTTWQEQIAEFVNTPAFPPVMAGFLIFSILIGFVIGFINTFGQSSLIDLVNQIEDDHIPTFTTGWQAGKRYVWQVFLIQFLIGLPILVVILGSLMPILIPTMQYLFRASSEGATFPELDFQGFTLFASMCCVGVPLGILTRIMSELAGRICVLKNSRVWGSIVGAWKLVRLNLGRLLLFALILAGVGLAIGVVFAVPTCLLAFGLAIPLTSLLNSSSSVGLVGLCGIAIFFWFIGMAINSVIKTYFSACWTLVYRELRGEPQAVVGTEMEVA